MIHSICESDPAAAKRRDSSSDEENDAMKEYATGEVQRPAAEETV